MNFDDLRDQYGDWILAAFSRLSPLSMFTSSDLSSVELEAVTSYLETKDPKHPTKSSSDSRKRYKAIQDVFKRHTAPTLTLTPDLLSSLKAQEQQNVDRQAEAFQERLEADHQDQMRQIRMEFKQKQARDLEIQRFGLQRLKETFEQEKVSLENERVNGENMLQALEQLEVEGDVSVPLTNQDTQPSPTPTQTTTPPS